MFGRYRLDRFLGAGGFAVVWQAYDTLTNAVVALKIFSSLDTQSIQELAAEYAGVHNLSHPSIVRAEHFDSLDNIPFLVMKYCPGGNLEHQEGRIGEQDVLQMMFQIADALTYVHSHGLVHQDIKPANILTEQTPTGTRYMLGDFGISAKSRTRLSKSVSVIAGAQSGSYLTFAYAPPEKFSPRREDRLPNAKGDIFSLGVTAYELATGFLPFDEIPTGQQLQNNPALQLDYTAIRDPRLRTFIAYCLAADPATRPDASTLAGWIGHGIMPPRPAIPANAPTQPAGKRHGASGNRQPKPRQTVRVQRPKRRSRTWLRALVLVLCLTMVAILSIFFFDYYHQRSYSVPMADSEYVEPVYIDDNAGAAEIEVATDSMPADAAEAVEAAPASKSDDRYEEDAPQKFSDRYTVTMEAPAPVDSGPK